MDAETSHRREVHDYILGELDGLPKIVAEIAFENGEDALVGKQRNIFDKHVRPLLEQNCRICGVEIEDHEFVGFMENGGYCEACGCVID